MVKPKHSRNYKSNTGAVNNIRFTNDDNRPFSIADSEIQRVSDFGGNGLIRDASTISIGTIHERTQTLAHLESGMIDLSNLKSLKRRMDSNARSNIGVKTNVPTALNHSH